MHRSAHIQLIQEVFHFVHVIRGCNRNLLELLAVWSPTYVIILMWNDLSFPSSWLLHLFALSLSFTLGVIIWSQFCFNGWDHFDSLKRGSKLPHYPDLSQPLRERVCYVCVLGCPDPSIGQNPKPVPGKKESNLSRLSQTRPYMTVPLSTQAVCSWAVKTVTAATGYKGLGQEQTHTWSQWAAGRKMKPGVARREKNIREVWSPERNKCLSSGSVS